MSRLGKNKFSILLICSWVREAVYSLAGFLWGGSRSFVNHWDPVACMALGMPALCQKQVRVLWRYRVMRLFVEGSFFYESLSALSLRVGFVFFILNYFWRKLRTQLIVSKIPECLNVSHMMCIITIMMQCIMHGLESIRYFPPVLLG
jgi:hypothetical protein